MTSQMSRVQNEFYCNCHYKAVVLYNYFNFTISILKMDYSSE